MESFVSVGPFGSELAPAEHGQHQSLRRPVVQQKIVDSFFGRLSAQDEEYMIDYYKQAEVEDACSPSGGRKTALS